MSIVGTKGARLDLLLRQGATFGPYEVTLSNPDLSPVNLNGVVFRSQIRRTPTSIFGEAIAPVFTYVNRPLGIFTFQFTAEDTATLAPGIDEDAPESLYYWDLEMEDAFGRVFPVLYGDVKVFREITKET
jgi:hypothetical protein